MKQPEGNGVLKKMIAVSDVNSDEAQFTTEYLYSNTGKIERTNSLNHEAELVFYEQFIYSDGDQLNRIEEYSANSNESSGFLKLTIHEFEYDTNGLVSKEIIINPVIGLTERITFEYDNLGNISAKTYYDSDNEIVKIEQYNYDTYGNVLKETSFDGNNEKIGETIHHYLNNLLYKSDVYILGLEKVHLEQIIKTYDQSNNLIMLQSNILWTASSRSSAIYKFIYD